MAGVVVPIPVLGLLNRDAAISQPNPLAAETGPRDIRSVRTLRLSVTDRCNFRCVYCMPEDKLDWIPRAEILSFEEIVDVARAALRHGITGFKLTGGEPLVRHDLPRLVAMLRAIPGVRDLSMTTNGSLLAEYAADLRRAGLDRITVSLDTLDAARFREITRGADIAAVWAGIDAACAAGFRHPKLNCVAMRGVNDDEFAAFARLTLQRDVTVRFIEYMPLGRTALGGEYERSFVSEEEIRAKIEAELGPLIPALADTGHGPAKVFRLARADSPPAPWGGPPCPPRPAGTPAPRSAPSAPRSAPSAPRSVPSTPRSVPSTPRSAPSTPLTARGRIGFISAMSKPFCSTCNRLRLTAQGQLRSCLFDGGEVELSPLLRDALLSDADRAARLHRAFVDCVAFKPEVHSYHGNRQMSQIGG